jgi:hypothetical protein
MTTSKKLPVLGPSQVEGDPLPDPEWEAYLQDYYAWRQEQGLSQCLQEIRWGPVGAGHLHPAQTAACLPRPGTVWSAPPPHLASCD